MHKAIEKSTWEGFEKVKAAYDRALEDLAARAQDIVDGINSWAEDQPEEFFDTPKGEAFREWEGLWEEWNGSLPQDGDIWVGLPKNNPGEPE